MKCIPLKKKDKRRTATTVPENTIQINWQHMGCKANWNLQVLKELTRLEIKDRTLQEYQRYNCKHSNILQTSKTDIKEYVRSITNWR